MDTTPGSGATVANVEVYNASSWTTVTRFPCNRKWSGGAGTQTDGLICSGTQAGSMSTTQGYDGTNWSTRTKISSLLEQQGASFVTANFINFNFWRSINNTGGNSNRRFYWRNKSS